MKRTQTDRARLVVESLTPYLKRFVMLGGFVQIKSVEDELLVVGEEDASVRLFPVALQVNVTYVDHVKIAGAHEVTDLVASSHQLTLTFRVQLLHVELSC